MTQVVELGHRAVFSNLEPFYLDAGRSQAADMWIDLTMNVSNATKVASLLGGEVSMYAISMHASQPAFSLSNEINGRTNTVS